MSEPNGQPRASITGTLVIATLLVLVGIATLYDSLSYTDVDSKVFPRAAAILLIVSSLVTLILALLKPVADEGFGSGSWWRRCLLISAMLVASLLMPMIGFVASSVLAFSGAMLAAMHDSWRIKNALIYGVSGVVVISGFYSLFKFGLNVPLP